MKSPPSRATPEADDEQAHSSTHIWTRVWGVSLLVLGIIGLLGVYFYIASGDPARYQALFLPVWTFMAAIPLLLAAADCYRRCWTHVSLKERWFLNVSFTLPVIAIAAAIAASFLL